MSFDAQGSVLEEFSGLIPGHGVKFAEQLKDEERVPDPNDLAKEWDGYPARAYHRV